MLAGFQWNVALEVLKTGERPFWWGMAEIRKMGGLETLHEVLCHLEARFKFLMHREKRKNDLFPEREDLCQPDMFRSWRKHCEVLQCLLYPLLGAGDTDACDGFDGFDLGFLANVGIVFVGDVGIRPEDGEENRFWNPGFGAMGSEGMPEGVESVLGDLPPASGNGN